ncbi:hypothetical protein [Anaerosporobacter sp.]|uniref:hypothetical protein n=1 Tax=Anaerosporobacter sp. TaxID=1872529 RepID=UPI00286EFC6E|nr:hypothetical protein [Anaerosporobacter sp.]
MKLEDRIIGFEHYQKRFDEWEATEQIIDENKAFWMLRKPDSQYQKVCLYRDSCNMFVYGDYGQFSFDSMTWTGSVHNLEYDNIGYQMEKLCSDSKKALYAFDDSECEKDIVKWFKDRLEERYDVEEENIEKIIDFVDKNGSDSFYIRDFIEENSFGEYEIESLLEFVGECYKNADEYEWIAFLRNNTDKLQEFEEAYESSLWNAGKSISQSYFICMYALKVCGEKLKQKKDS